MVNLVKAVLNVMKEVEGIEKKMKVGTGQSAYDGISDADVKEAIGQSMRDNGLVIFTTKIEPKVEVSRWDETTYYNGTPSGVKQKQSVFCEVLTEYTLMHESGESMVIKGYGHGVDSQDKSAGKATTYALKNTLMNTFLVASKKMDDSDKTHSNDLPVPPNQNNSPVKPRLNLENPESYASLVQRLVKSHNDIDSDIKALTDKYSITNEEIEAIKSDVAKIRFDQSEQKEVETKEGSKEDAKSETGRKLLTESIKKQIKEAKTMTDVTKIFNENKELQSNQSFIDLLAEKREEIKPKSNGKQSA